MPTETVCPMFVAEDQTENAYAQLYLRTPLPRGRFHAFFADAVSHLAGNLAYGMTWALCGLLELGDPGPHGSHGPIQAAASLPSPAELPARPAESAAEAWARTGVRTAGRPGLEIASYPAVAGQVTSVVQPGAYRGL